MITIYGIGSPYAARVRAALIWKDLPFEHVNVDLGKKSAEFLRLTPIETVPVVQDGDIVLCDSLHALDYFDRHYPATYQMLGGNERERARVLTVMEACNKIASYFGPLYMENASIAERMQRSGKSFRVFQYSPEQKKDLQAEISYRLNRIKEFYGSQQFCIGRFSAADAAVLALLRSTVSFGMDIGAWKEWQNMLLQQEKIASMFPSENEKGVRSI
ncbi:glutathione S-transferase [Candidatus Woesearchaeota archaeon]|nr:glutathione S-transferase [Candidatus Woesearchaeota archaeon]